MTKEEKWDFLKGLDSARVYYSSGTSSEFSYNGFSVYFRHYNGQSTYSTYDRFGWNETEQILNYMDHIVRIDKKLDNGYYPLWTLEEGLVKEGINFIKLNGKYYSATFLENILNQINNLKCEINQINV